MKSSFPVVGIILPAGTGGRTLLLSLKRYIEEEMGFRVQVLDCKKSRREDFFNEVTNLCKLIPSPQYIFLNHTEIIPGLHKALAGVPAAVITDWALRKSVKIPISSYKLLRPAAFERLNRSRRSLIRWMKSLT